MDANKAKGVSDDELFDTDAERQAYENIKKHEAVEAKQGWAGQAWGGLKYAARDVGFDIGTTYGDVYKQTHGDYHETTQTKDAEVLKAKGLTEEHFEQVGQTIEHYEENQDNGAVGVKIVAGIGVGIALAPVAAAAGAGGAAIAGSEGLAATVGSTIGTGVVDAAVGVAIDGSDAMSGGREYTAGEAAEGAAMGFGIGLVLRPVARYAGKAWRWAKGADEVVEEAVPSQTPKVKAKKTKRVADEQPVREEGGTPPVSKKQKAAEARKAKEAERAQQAEAQRQAREAQAAQNRQTMHTQHGAKPNPRPNPSHSSPDLKGRTGGGVRPNINDEAALKEYVPDNGLVREAGNKGRQIPLKYRQNAAEARFRMEQAMNDGSYSSPQAYKKAMQEAHDISYRGRSGNNLYYEKSGQLLNMTGGKIRGRGVLKNQYSAESDQIVDAGRNYNATYIGARRLGYSNRVRLKGIPEDGLPLNLQDAHIYPDGKYMDIYFQKMQETGKEALDLINQGAPNKDIVAKIAEHYQYAANARPFTQINNSLFMNEINLMLRRAGLDEIPHGILDHAAQRFQPEVFQRYFTDYVEQFNPGLRSSRAA